MKLLWLELQLAELIRRRRLPVSSRGELNMDQLLSLLREVRGKGT